MNKLLVSFIFLSFSLVAQETRVPISAALSNSLRKALSYMSSTQQQDATTYTQCLVSGVAPLCPKLFTEEHQNLPAFGHCKLPLLMHACPTSDHKKLRNCAKKIGSKQGTCKL